VAISSAYSAISANALIPNSHYRAIYEPVQNAMLPGLMKIRSLRGEMLVNRYTAMRAVPNGSLPSSKSIKLLIIALF